MSTGGEVGIYRLEQHRDHRGSVFEPLGADELAEQRNAHVVLTVPGHVRGNHWHRRGTEIMAVRGPARVRYRDMRMAGPTGEERTPGEVRDVQVPAGEVVVFRFPPHVAHAVLNTGTVENLLVAFRDVPHDPSADDTVREVLIPPIDPPDPHRP